MVGGLARVICALAPARPGAVSGAGMARRFVMALAWVAMSASTARAEMPARLSVAGQGGCPTAAALARALERLHPALRAEVDGGAAARVEVLDRGGGYEVRAAGRTRRLEDVGRRCSERATAAALAVTLILDPPTAPPPEEPEGPLAPRETPPAAAADGTGPANAAPSSPAGGAPSPPTGGAPSRPASAAPSSSPASAGASPPASAAPSPPASTAAPSTPPAAPAPTGTRSPPVSVGSPAAVAAAAPASTNAAAAGTPAIASAPAPAASPPAGVARPASRPARARPTRIELEASGVVDGAPSAAGAASEVTGGAALRLAVGGRYVAGALGLAGLAPATATSSAIDVRVVRIPFDLSVRLVLPLGRVELGSDVGLALAVLQLSAAALSGAVTNTRLDVGVRIAPFAHIELTRRLALVLGLQMIVSFAPYELDVQPIGKIATTPRLWLGGGLGLAVRL